MAQLPCCPAAWGQDQHACWSLSPAPNHSGKTKGQDLVPSGCGQGQKWLQWACRVRTYTQEQENLTKGGKALGHPLLPSTLHPTGISPAREPNREVASSCTLNHPHHREGSETPVLAPAAWFWENNKTPAFHFQM